MKCYSVQPRDQIFVKGYGFLSFAKNMDRNIGKNRSKNFRGNTPRKLLIMINNLLWMHLKLLQRNSRSNW